MMPAIIAFYKKHLINMKNTIANSKIKMKNTSLLEEENNMIA